MAERSGGLCSAGSKEPRESCSGEMLPQRGRWPRSWQSNRDETADGRGGRQGASQQDVPGEHPALGGTERRAQAERQASWGAVSMVLAPPCYGVRPTHATRLSLTELLPVEMDVKKSGA